MEENLIGYLLGALDDATSHEIEEQLRRDPTLQEQLKLLRKALYPLSQDAEPQAPPADLVVRTLCRVAEHICSEDYQGEPYCEPASSDCSHASYGSSNADLPHSPVLRFEPTSQRAWWRRVDVLVAACLFVTTLGALIPALDHLRSPAGDASLIACQNNLREFFQGLQTYRDQHGRFPNVTEEGPRNVAGMMVPILADAGTLSPTASIRCPALGPHVGCEISLETLRAMTPEQFAQHTPQLSQSYAYSLGYRDETGAYHAPGLNPIVASSLIPLMGDRVSGEDIQANSNNHGGKGQNILFADGHVNFCTSRMIANDDLFLNRENVVAAGVGAFDAVLGSSGSRP